MRVLSCVAAVIASSWLAWFATGPIDHGVAFWVASAVVVGGALAGALLDPKRHASAHVAIVVAQLVALAGFTGMRVVGEWPFAWDAMPDRRYAALITSLALATAIGLALRQVWARWIALAFAATTMLGGMLNTIGMDLPRDEGGLENALGVLGGLVIMTQLLAPSVRERFQSVQPLWTSRDRLVRTSRWAAIAGFAAAPMLLLYALCQPVAPDTVTSALVLAPVIGAGSALVVARRTVGILVLGLGGVALAIHAIVTLLHADPRMIAVYYVAFWSPAALLGMAAGVLAIARAGFAGPRSSVAQVDGRARHH